MLIGMSFFARHLAGWVFTKGLYNPLVYNPTSIKTLPPPDYNFEPDSVVWDEHREYARFTQEVLRGEILGSIPASYNPYLLSGTLQNYNWYRDRLGPILLALIAHTLSGNVPLAFMLADFIFPLILALCLFFLSWQFRPTVLFSVFATSVIVWFNWQDILGFTYFLQGNMRYSPLWMRTPYPQVSGILFALFLIALIRLIREPTLLSGFFLSAMMVLNFYCYFYSWSFMLIIAIICILFLLLPNVGVIRHLNNRKNIPRIIIPSTLLAMAFAIPIFETFVFQPVQFRDSFLRVFGVYTHSPNWRYTAILFLPLAVTLLFDQPRWKMRWFWTVFWTASLILVNQQIFTGKENQPGHWMGMLIQPFAVLFFCEMGIIALELLQTNYPSIASPHIKVMVVIGLVLVGFSINITRSIQQAQYAFEYNYLDPSFTGVLQTLRSPSLQAYGFLTNDPYLDIVMPGYLYQKPLNPWYMDPLSNDEIQALRGAATMQFGQIIGEKTTKPQSSIRLDPQKVLFILNRHRMTYSGMLDCQIVYVNDDFIVAKAACSP